MSFEPKRILFTVSGKGGVGKSTVAAQVAASLAARGLAVGLLDADLTGPSAARALGVPAGGAQATAGGEWLPVAAPGSGVLLMSVALLTADESAAVIWRGPKKTAVLRQLLLRTRWGALDWLVVDTPPGSSDEHMALAEAITGAEVRAAGGRLFGAANPNPAQAFVAGAIVVTTPQRVATTDVARSLDACKTLGWPVLGVVENMSAFVRPKGPQPRSVSHPHPTQVCPHCAHCTHIFDAGGGERLAAEFGVPLLASLPLDAGLAAAVDAGERAPAATAVAAAIEQVVEAVVSRAPAPA